MWPMNSIQKGHHNAESIPRAWRSYDEYDIYVALRNQLRPVFFQQCCQHACRILEWMDISNRRSQVFETLQDHSRRHLICHTKCTETEIRVINWWFESIMHIKPCTFKVEHNQSLQQNTIYMHSLLESTIFVQFTSIIRWYKIDSCITRDVIYLLTSITCFDIKVE